MTRDLLFLPGLDALRDAVLLALRLATGAFLAYHMWFNISDSAAMREVVGYFEANGFVWPRFFAPLSAWAQFLIGIALILGLLARWAGLLLAFNFVVGIVMVHWHESFRDWWPALALVLIGLVLAAFGPGRLSLDSRLQGRRQ